MGFGIQTQKHDPTFFQMWMYAINLMFVFLILVFYSEIINGWNAVYIYSLYLLWIKIYFKDFFYKIYDTYGWSLYYSLKNIYYNNLISPSGDKYDTLICPKNIYKP